MWQEILVFGLFILVLGFTVYNLFFAKKKNKGCGCDGCS
ncbi:FeoB-associated Cys-rich membrane protein [Arthrospiribacter ruber]|uniref:FeoB-associated Cys-rich membrane protein n=1 Tax=Arthrospiribacter ruber TaxID=2487934 RepID=A0A951MGQ0_9BACT|nr:FeoB-associated Cys-rich membrane protein [Arthrospiribacter ruber]